MARDTISDRITPLASAPAAPRPVALSLLASLRPAQWTKNLIIFGARGLGQRLLDPRSLLQATAAFAIFCVLSGVVYLINDIADREADRGHPVKMHRPIASGALPVRVALGAAVVLGTVSLAAAFLLRPQFGFVAAAYLGLLALYSGLFTDVQIRTHVGEALPKVSVDAEQIRRVLINLIDNAVEAMDRHGAIEIETQHDPANNLVRIVVADNGPGIPLAERDKLFLPYYSTKRRGSGLGLAIVRRIVAEHGGSIEVTDNTPRGTRFAIELPA